MLRKNRLRIVQEVYRRTASEIAIRSRHGAPTFARDTPRSYAYISSVGEAIIRRGRSADGPSDPRGEGAVARTGSGNGDKATQSGRIVVTVSSTQYIYSVRVPDWPVNPAMNQLLLRTRIPMNARNLPAPRLEGPLSLEAAIARRRSHRVFSPQPLSSAEIGQLLWAAQGITGSDGWLRASPSAMEAYPLELFVATADGVGRYSPSEHILVPLLERDLREDLKSAAHDQDSVTSAPAVFVFAAVYSRAVEKLGPGAEPYVHMDLGHAAQNLLLQAEALGLSGVPIAWLEPDRVRTVLELPPEQVPLYLVPVGRSDP